MSPSSNKTTKTSAKTAKTVKFNVGGSRYEVSRSLIEKYPKTMLARLVSDTWHSDPDSEIFVEASGEQFQHVLSYMRHKKVHLPLCVSKAAVLQNLDYFGFENVQSGEVNGGCGKAEAAKQLAQGEKEYQTLMKDYKGTIGKCKKNMIYLSVARACLLIYSTTGTLRAFEWRDFKKHVECTLEEYEDAFSEANFDQLSLDESLKLYGLVHVGHPIRHYTVIQVALLDLCPTPKPN